MASPKAPPVSIEASEKTEQKLKGWQRFSWTRWIRRDEPASCAEEKEDLQLSKPSLGRRLSRRVVPGLPRPATFRRQNSERRERLPPVQQPIKEKRTLSADRRRALSAQPSPWPRINGGQLSVPEVRELGNNISTITRRETWPEMGIPISEAERLDSSPPSYSPPPVQHPNVDAGDPAASVFSPEDDIDEEIREELEKKWILNLSMHFRDNSPREKFFLTYAETPQRWRRVTVTCDYRDALADSIERDLQSLQYQRDKSARIYEAIRSSLPDIQFYDTVTNLKLDTKDDRLHVHVTEDINEIIPYPKVDALEHLGCMHYTESELQFESHMSGFVYKVRVHGHVWIKKEIPGPDSVDEFLYEVNALDELIGSSSVIQFQGLVVDASRSIVKGLLIGFAKQGALIDIIYDNKGQLPWSRRERWAKQIIQGLSEIHEAGFVQGDFTLSNIVIDEKDEAKIIDINRRGCPLGWEPPELSKLIKSGLRISMYIGVKSDLFQLGMVLWALAEEEDEPERQPRPLKLSCNQTAIPQYYRELTSACLSSKPRYRLAAKELLAMFPASVPLPPKRGSPNQYSRDPSSERSAEFPYPNGHSIGYSRSQAHRYSSDDDAFESRPGSHMVTPRGRQPAANTSHLVSDSSHNTYPGRGASGDPQIVSISPTRPHHGEEIELNGTPCLIQRDSIHLEDVEPPAAGAPAQLGRNFTHIDSGLADMDLAGVGGNEALSGEENAGADNRTPPSLLGAMHLDLGVESCDGTPQPSNDKFEHENCNGAAENSAS